MLKKIGNFSWKHGKKWHHANITEVEFQDEETILFRYETECMFGKMNPLLKLNRERDLVYFLSERSSNGSYPYPEFETRGCECIFKLYTDY